MQIIQSNDRPWQLTKRLGTITYIATSRKDGQAVGKNVEVYLSGSEAFILVFPNKVYMRMTFSEFVEGIAKSSKLVADVLYDGTEEEASELLQKENQFYVELADESVDNRFAFLDNQRQMHWNDELIASSLTEAFNTVNALKTARIKPI